MKIFILLFALTAFVTGCRTVSTDMSISTDAFGNEYKNSLSKARKIYEDILSVSGTRTVDNTLGKLNELSIILDNIAGKASLFYNTHPNEQTRAIAKQCQQDVSKFATEISLSRPLYEACVKVDISKEDDVTKRHHKHLLRDLRRSGVSQEKEKRDQIAGLIEELVLLGQDFSKNIREDVRTIELSSVADLDGLPEDYIKAHPANDKGEITLTTDYPDYLPFMTYAKNDSIRLEYYKIFRNRAYPANTEQLITILTKRYELAQILGYKNYAEYITETKMIKNPSNAQNFMKRVNDIALARSKADYKILLDKLKETSPDAKEVGDWQKTYLKEKVKQEKFKVDSKELRQYFQAGKVKEGIISLTEDMFGVKITQCDAPVWHEDVKAFEVHEGNKLIAMFYLDLYPRDDKYKHAAHFGLQSGIKDVQIPISTLVCNFPGKDDDTELMEHSQVLTFLHEFGHMLHHMFANGHEWLSFAGISTEWDFVEAPSQMLEEWLWSPDVLKRFAVNTKGETIPDELVAKSVAAKDFGAGLWARNQMYYAAMSMEFYNCNPSTLNMDEKMRELQNQYSPYNYVDDTHMYASFGHLYGYSAIYYTYMWSQVIAKDLFAQFEQNGILNTEVAMRYRKSILEPGGSKDAEDLVKDFLGRPFNFDGFERWLNRN